MTTQYKKFVKLIAKWPLDPTKGERDLGKVLRDQVKLAFESKQSSFDTELCNRQYKALNKLADNTYRNKYKRDKWHSATGLSAEECNAILSTDMLNHLKEEDKGLLKKLFNKKS